MKLLSNGAQVVTGLGLLSVASIALIQLATPGFAQDAMSGGTTSAPSAGTPSSNGTSTTPAPGTGATPGTNTTNANGDASGITPGSAADTTPPSGVTPGTTTPDTGVGTTPGSSTTMPGVGTPTPGLSGINPTPGYSTNLNPSNTTPGMGQGSLPVNNLPPSTSTIYSTPAAPITQDSMNGMNRFGGPMYDSSPDLDLTASFIGAGGGPYNFSIWTALEAMGGRQFAEDEKLNLQAQFGVDKVANWSDTFQFAVLDSYLQAKKNGIDLPINSTYVGPLLGQKVIDAGQDNNKTFYCGTFMDRTISHGIHWQVMRDIDSMNGEPSDHDFHKITNQAMVDLAHQLGFQDVKGGDVSDDYMMNNMNMNGTVPATPAQ